MTIGITTLSITRNSTLSISITIQNETLSITYCRLSLLFNFAIKPLILSVVSMNLIMLSVIRLNVVMFGVVAP
jgi:hypothetical protein